jgi:hypothetical protein
MVKRRRRRRPPKRAESPAVPVDQPASDVDIHSFHGRIVDSKAVVFRRPRAEKKPPET